MSIRSISSLRLDEVRADASSSQNCNSCPRKEDDLVICSSSGDRTSASNFVVVIFAL